jgi:hypothetical protein
MNIAVIKLAYADGAERVAALGDEHQHGVYPSIRKNGIAHDERDMRTAARPVAYASEDVTLINLVVYASLFQLRSPNG